MTTGEKIRKCRKEADLTQSELAELAGVSLATILRYERGDNPSEKNLLKISEALNTDFSPGKDRLREIARSCMAMIHALEETNGVHIMIDQYDQGCINVWNGQDDVSIDLYDIYGKRDY